MAGSGWPVRSLQNQPVAVSVQAESRSVRTVRPQLPGVVPQTRLASSTAAAGYAPPELDYAAGLALGELYKKALEATKRIENGEQRKVRVAAIESEYKQPALRHLRAALGARLERHRYFGVNDYREIMDRVPQGFLARVSNIESPQPLPGPSE